ncbi:hypothetical protein XELAEV_18004151mg [Xenopus laevis]|uniref:G-protein coupled receptors family 1 profile domain-containing protein n=1 Tax=Xenopus laevis TaxID=8355 RepID=A0A974BS21_XENLA|nr:hypothetical protein XELAEV_18004151mg [Xenopus laevis]
MIEYVAQAIRFTCFSLTFILGTVGNGLVIWITGFKMKKTMTTIWFLNLGITDFSFCLILPLYITEWALWGNWPFGRIMCKISNFSTALNLSASLLFLTTISIDRCICILYPIWSRNHRTSRLAAIISAIIWLVSMAAYSPLILLIDNINDSNFSECSLTNGAWENVTIIDFETSLLRFQAMIITRFVFSFLIPLSIIVVCYGLIAFRVRKSSRIPGCLNPIIYVFTGRDFKQILRKSIPFLLESPFNERNDPPEIPEENGIL